MIEFKEVYAAAIRREPLPAGAAAEERGFYYAIQGAYDMMQSGMLPQEAFMAHKLQMVKEFRELRELHQALTDGYRRQQAAAKRAAEGCKALLDATTPEADPYALLLMAADVICAARGEEQSSLRRAIEARRRGVLPLATRASKPPRGRRRAG